MDKPQGENAMNDKILSLSISSPEELEKQLNRIRSSERQRFEYLILSLGGKDLIVQPFSFQDIPVRKLKDQLQMEAIELLNLPANQIVFDFQIFQASKEKISGIFVCISKDYLMQLSTLVQKYKLSLVMVTSYLLSSLNSFMLKHRTTHGRFCLLELCKDANINLSVICERQFELIRRVPFESFDEAKHEIIRSLRSVSSKSHMKELGGIFLRGDVPEKEIFIQDLESVFNTRIQYDEAEEIENDLLSNESIFSINLMRNYCMSLEERKKALLATHLFLSLCLLGNAYLGFKISKQSRTIQTLKSTDKEEEQYDVAKNEVLKNSVKL